MEYKYLQKWILENTHENLVFKDIKKFEDQYTIFFNKKKIKLQINLSSNAFMFFTKQNQFDFKHTNELKQWSQLLSKSRLKNIEIFRNDRIIQLLFEKVGIFNEIINYLLVVELIPRYQNIILKKDDNKIVDCLKKISFMENTTRQVLPGIEYKSPDTNFEIEHSIINFPINYNEKGKIVENDKGYKIVNSCFEDLYYNFSIDKKIESIKKRKMKSLKRTLKKKKRKIGKLEVELSDSSRVEELQQKAELAKSNFHLLKNGTEKILVKNYYSPEMEEVTIKLKSDKSPQQNIDLLFKRVKKAKNAKIHLDKQISITIQEIEELEKQIFDIEHIDDYQEAIELVQVEKKTKNKKKKKHYKKLRINDDWEIFIGRTSTENDFLTTRFAKPYDWWFHTRVFRGTHIILRNYNKKNIDEKLIRLCCRLAAYFSKAKKSSNVPVDYTEIRYVRKPHGAAPGFVTYKNQKTIFLDPISMRAASKYIEKEY
ncbi:MAG: NFACT RNA binding domain-containing protein [Candidatus Cloacimonadota bacterium]|nr:NFACT RNA binding domain-containing protein [Candidatus Cloacimonadota bacterium]